ncbi:MAG: competence/damage-inducible protein A [Chloroflexota bacterium]
MKAEILSVGTELLLGHLVDTNAPYLAQHLSTLGIDLYWISQNGDNRGRLTEALRRAWGRADLIIVSGGLGPTEDDVTREAIADLLGEQMVVVPELETHLRALFASRGVEMPEANVKQATLIVSAQAIPNPLGTAPGWWVERDGRFIVAMPGVPLEMHRMWTVEVLPRLRQLVGAGVILSRNLKVMGLGESAVEDRIRELVGSTNPTVATYAKPDGIHVRVTAKARTDAEALELIDPMEAKVRGILGTFIYGQDDDTLEGVVGNLLREKGFTVATVEHCTAGLLASTINNVPGSYEYFKGGIVAVSTERLLSLGLDPGIVGVHGCISVEAAEAMATLARRSIGADVGVGVVGVPGPEQLEGKPVGTMHYAVDNRGTITSGGRTWPSTIEDFKRRTMLGALNLLRRSLLEA